MSHDDIRHSLEVLDSVLAEFDDCLESWDTPHSTETLEKFQPGDINLNGGKNHDRFPNDDKLSLDNARGGSTSHNSSSNVQEQPKVGSPPPIPKRNPSTRLSEQILSPFSFSSDNTSLDSYDSNRSDSAVHGDVLSNNAQISGLSSLKKDDDTPPHSITKNTYGPDNCSNCGRGLKRVANAMESTEDADIPSPFQQRKQMFETKIADGSTNTPTPAGVNRSYGSSFRVRKTPPQVDICSGPLSLPVSLSESGIDSESQLSNEVSFNSSSVGDDSDISLPGTHHVVNCSCREKIRKLNEKFSATRRLLRLNSINGLDSEPPSFVPPPPPIVNGVNARKNDNLVLHSDNCSIDGTEEVFRMNGDSSGIHKGKDLLQDSEAESFHTVNSSNESIRSTDYFLEESSDSKKLTSSARLCNKCSSALSAHLATTIEDLPNLLPTDALNRPHLGLSYSLEDDLSPGVKEIQKTSTPKSDLSSASLFKTKDSNLSTFSHSASSLGYVSSQSDLELNNLPTVPDKVPVSTFRSRTLPNGLDRSPFYSPVDEVFERPYSPNEPKDHNGNRYLKTGHMSTEDLQLRSSSAPPPPEADKPKKKHFRFSRKDKKDKKKNDDSLSLKSDLSLDEGIILRKIGALDGSTVLSDAASEKHEVGVEKKRRSMWRSLMGKK
ncbi:uncharacterized protein NPIL_157851 [Nephila pilipes]|uniref:Uncharacterized protein n=1 Tax=Nephila pilipes TaxID=299642 RepID=A0A8X6QGE8_NEPPI|nr:uncharacterized protein NPIL_157851 [Nephila pilipes]